jgi:alpha-2-macroglobulin
LNYYFHGEAGKKQMKLAEVKVHKWLADIKPEQLVQPRVRKAFPDTTFWVADVKTGADGKASVKFNFPDSLTTWRTTARGITADTKVGRAVEKVIVRKNLMVRLAVPGFFRQGDQVTISALVHNYLPTAKDARVSMNLKGLDVIDGATRDIKVPSKGEVKVDWRVRAANVSQSSTLQSAHQRGIGCNGTNAAGDSIRREDGRAPFRLARSQRRHNPIHRFPRSK